MLHLLRDHRSQSLIPNPVHDHSHNALPRSLTRHHRTTSLNWKNTSTTPSGSQHLIAHTLSPTCLVLQPIYNFRKMPSQKHDTLPSQSNFIQSQQSKLVLTTTSSVASLFRSQWAHRQTVMVVTAKKDGSPRCTVDFQYLNSQCKRETHHTASPFHLACQIPPHTRKTVLDAVDGYHAIQLDEESQPLTTFITEWGRYYYRRIPQGFLASGDVYTRWYDEIIQDFPRKVKIVDDTLLYDDDIESAFFHTFDYLTLCTQNGIVFNESKFQFCRDEVKFGGLTITASGVSPSNSMLDSIDNFPSPKSITDARSWFGLVNQVAWAYSLSPVMQPFRDLLKPEAKFYWDDQLEETFAKSKLQILSLVREGISAFDINRNTCLAPDWSQTGMGFLLLQQYC